MSTLVPAWMPPHSIRRWKAAARRAFDALWCDATVPLQPFGKVNVWSLYSAQLDADSVVLSGGVGQDITTELELVDTFGCHIDLFDPSPTGVATMELLENQRDKIDYRTLGLAGKNGPVGFSEPVKPEEGSFTVSRDGGGLEFPCTSLSAFANSRGYSLIDLVKLDIEGFEYEVIEDLLKNAPPVNQLCIEFHHFESHISWRETARALKLMGESGFQVVHKNCFDYTLLHTRRLGLR